MNAHFRRDYAYLMTIKVRGLEQQIPVRYLKYDRQRKEYIFVEGLTRSVNEVQFRFKHTQAMTAIKRMTKKHHIGYGATNYYLGNECNYRLPQYLRKSQINKPTTQKVTPSVPKVDFLEVGKSYSFSAGSAKVPYVSNRYTFKVLAKIKNELDMTVYQLQSDDGLRQQCLEAWLTTGEVIATEIPPKLTELSH
jgi:hypothetical protein